jgi:DNA-binding transcriptional LysR family regulator
VDGRQHQRCGTAIPEQSENCSVDDLKTCSTSNPAAIDAAARGFGITRLLSYQIAPYLASGQLKAVLGAYEPARLPIHIVHREGRQASAKVRTFVDLLVEKLQTDKALN